MIKRKDFDKNLITKIRELNSDNDVDGIIVQLPIPKHLNENDIINEIDNTTIETNEPLKELKRLLPKFVIQKGNSGNWNIVLWHIPKNFHL